MNFTWGNIFIDGKIEETEKLKEDLGLSDWNPEDPEEIWHTLHDKQKELDRILGGRVEVSLITYADGEACFDFYVSGEKKEVTKYREEFQMDIKLWELWEKYSKRMFENVQNGVQYKQDMTKGYFLSEDEVMRRIEEEFIDLVPNYIDGIKKVLFGCKDDDKRAGAAYLIGWHDDRKEALELLSRAIAEDPSHHVHNNALRVMVPLTRVLKVSIPDAVLNMLYHPSTACINKALWLISEVSKEDLISIPKRYKERIQILSEVKQKNLRDIAKEIIKKGLQ